MSLLARLKDDAKRWRTALILLAVVALVGVFHSVWTIGAFLTLVFVAASKEAIALFGHGNNWKLWLACVAVWIAAIFYPRPIEAIVLTILIAASIVAFDQKRDLKIALPLLYPAAPLLFLFSLYTEFGIGAYVWLFVTVAACDIGAYYAGKALGKTPFSPSSPNKTIEGVAGGVTAAAIFGTIAGVLASIKTVGGVLISIDFLPILAITTLCAIASIFGDLFESYLKRKAGVKDSGKILPGHGGALDRIDGYLFAGVVLLFGLRLAAI
ncbi:MAG: phosphatidate cytidylyltransferase [Helicobacteraceae bacterium]|jgi:phosphatidate cytidylyltransferase|nr:phosphatidate cytidylyltransferase [Helicobacteraceae bacterium]